MIFGKLDLNSDLKGDEKMEDKEVVEQIIQGFLVYIERKQEERFLEIAEKDKRIKELENENKMLRDGFEMRLNEKIENLHGTVLQNQNYNKSTKR